MPPVRRLSVVAPLLPRAVTDIPPWTRFELLPDPLRGAPADSGTLSRLARRQRPGPLQRPVCDRESLRCCVAGLVEVSPPADSKKSLRVIVPPQPQNLLLSTPIRTPIANPVPADDLTISDQRPGGRSWRRSSVAGTGTAPPPPSSPALVPPFFSSAARSRPAPSFARPRLDVVLAQQVRQRFSRANHLVDKLPGHPASRAAEQHRPTNPNGPSEDRA